MLLLGGARSGKSRLAVSLAERAGAPVTFVATAEALDDEMRRRIELHREERPPAWRTVEAPLELETAVVAVPPGRSVVIDCLSLWVSNLLGRGDDRAAILAAAQGAAAAAAGRAALSVAVSNEVGLGVVPATALGRAYRDVLGEVNRLWADAADEASFVVAGRRLRLE